MGNPRSCDPSKWKQISGELVPAGFGSCELDAGPSNGHHGHVVWDIEGLGTEGSFRRNPGDALNHCALPNTVVHRLLCLGVSRVASSGWVEPSSYFR